MASQSEAHVVVTDRWLTIERFHETYGLTRASHEMGQNQFQRMIQHAGFFWLYDESADVLHVSTDPSIAAYGEALENFENVIVLMRNFDTDDVVGFRVLDAKRNGIVK